MHPRERPPDTQSTVAVIITIVGLLTLLIASFTAPALAAGHPTQPVGVSERGIDAPTTVTGSDAVFISKIQEQSSPDCNGTANLTRVGVYPDGANLSVAVFVTNGETATPDTTLEVYAAKSLVLSDRLSVPPGEQRMAVYNVPLTEAIRGEIRNESINPISVRTDADTAVVGVRDIPISYGIDYTVSGELQTACSEGVVERWSAGSPRQVERRFLRGDAGRVGFRDTNASYPNAAIPDELPPRDIGDVADERPDAGPFGSWVQFWTRDIDYAGANDPLREADSPDVQRFRFGDLKRLSRERLKSADQFNKQNLNSLAADDNRETAITVRDYNDTVSDAAVSLIPSDAVPGGGAASGGETPAIRDAYLKIHSIEGATVLHRPEEKTEKYLNSRSNVHGVLDYRLHTPQTGRYDRETVRVCRNRVPEVALYRGGTKIANETDLEGNTFTLHPLADGDNQRGLGDANGSIRVVADVEATVRRVGINITTTPKDPQRAAVAREYANGSLGNFTPEVRVQQYVDGNPVRTGAVSCYSDGVSAQASIEGNDTVTVEMPRSVAAESPAFNVSPSEANASDDGGDDTANEGTSENNSTTTERRPDQDDDNDGIEDGNNTDASPIPDPSNGNETGGGNNSTEMVSVEIEFEVDSKSDVDTWSGTVTVEDQRTDYEVPAPEVRVVRVRHKGFLLINENLSAAPWGTAQPGKWNGPADDAPIATSPWAYTTVRNTAWDRIELRSEKANRVLRHDSRAVSNDATLRPAIIHAYPMDVQRTQYFPEPLPYDIPVTSVNASVGVPENVVHPTGMRHRPRMVAFDTSGRRQSDEVTRLHLTGPTRGFNYHVTPNKTHEVVDPNIKASVEDINTSHIRVDVRVTTPDGTPVNTHHRPNASVVVNGNTVQTDGQGAVSTVINAPVEAPVRVDYVAQPWWDTVVALEHNDVRNPKTEAVFDSKTIYVERTEPFLANINVEWMLWVILSLILLAIVVKLYYMSIGANPTPSEEFWR